MNVRTLPLVYGNQNLVCTMQMLERQSLCTSELPFRVDESIVSNDCTMSRNIATYSKVVRCQEQKPSLSNGLMFTYQQSKALRLNSKSVGAMCCIMLNTRHHGKTWESKLISKGGAKCKYCCVRQYTIF